MRLRPLAIPAALAAVALGGLAAPAQAAPDADEPFVVALLPEQVTVIEGKTKTVRAEVFNAGRVAAKGVRLQFGDVDPSIGLRLPAGCDADSCEIGDLAPEGRKVISFTVAPTGEKLVQSFDVSIGGRFETTVAVARSTGGVDIEVDPIDDFKLDRGGAEDLPITVRNAGSETVNGVAMLVLTEPGIFALTEYRNCLSLADVPELAEDEINGYVCEFDQKFAPDATLTVPDETPVQIKLDENAGGPYTYSAAVIAVGMTDEISAGLTAKSSGPLLKLDTDVEAADISDLDPDEDLNGEDNIATFGVTVGKSAADTLAVGASFAGAIGDTRTVAVGVRNAGPTNTIPGTFDWLPSVRVTVPAGVKLTEVDVDCLPGTDPGEWNFEEAGTVNGRDYVCFPVLGIREGEQVLFEFTGTITEASAPGAVVVDGGVQDGKAANDKAELGITLTAGGGAGEGGEGGGGSLPITGAPIGWLALGGALLLIAGATAAYVFRRRRIITTL